MSYKRTLPSTFLSSPSTNIITVFLTALHFSTSTSRPPSTPRRNMLLDFVALSTLFTLVSSLPWTTQLQPRQEEEASDEGLTINLVTNCSVEGHFSLTFGESSSFHFASSSLSKSHTYPESHLMLQHSVSFLANFQRSERRSKAKLTFDVASFSFLEKPVEQSKFLTFLSSLAFLADHAFPSVFLSYRHRPSVCSHGAQIDSVSRFDRGRVPWIDARPSLREQLLHLFSFSLYICLTLSRFSPTIRPSSELLKSRTRRGSADDSNGYCSHPSDCTRTLPSLSS